MNQKIITVILAGGFGTRIKHLLPDIPKPMAEVANKPFLEWIIRYCNFQGLDKFVLSTGYLGQKIKSYFRSQIIDNITIKCCEEKEPLGTAGGFINSYNHISEKPDSWLVINGDSLIFTDLKPFFNRLNDSNTDGVILGLSVEDASRYGSLEYDSNDNLISFAEKKSGKGVINAGIYLFKQRIIPKFPSHTPLSFEYDIFPYLLSQGCKIKVHITSAPFLDIGTPESLNQAEKFILDNQAYFASLF